MDLGPNVGGFFSFFSVICAPPRASVLPSVLSSLLHSMLPLWSITVDGKDFVGVTLEDSC